MKKTFSLICLILASIIGAGLASGKEIEIFFTKYGLISIVLTILTLLLFAYAIAIYLLFGNKYDVHNIFDVNKIMFGRFYKFINLCFIICYYIVLSGMFAGVSELYSFIFSPLVSKALVVITAFLCVLENMGGMKSIYIINNIFVPITIIILVVFAIFKINDNEIINLDFSIFNTSKCIMSIFKYVGINILLTGNILIQEGQNFTKKTIITSAVISTIVLVLIITIFNIVLLQNNIISELPMITLSFNVNYVLGIVVLLSIWFCIFSAITSLSYVLAHCFTKPNLKSNIFIVVIAYLISLFGFEKIIEYLYPIIGVLGLIFTTMLSIKYFKNSNYNFAMQNSSIWLNKAKK